MRNQQEMIFAKELWKLVLEIEEYVRNHYRDLVDREIYDLHDQDEDIPEF